MWLLAMMMACEVMLWLEVLGPCLLGSDSMPAYPDRTCLAPSAVSALKV